VATDELSLLWGKTAQLGSHPTWELAEVEILGKPRCTLTSLLTVPLGLIARS
jgi:hypothetical protein